MDQARRALNVRPKADCIPLDGEQENKNKIFDKCLAWTILFVGMSWLFLFYMAMNLIEQEDE
jgi:hypothetical protein